MRTFVSLPVIPYSIHGLSLLSDCSARFLNYRIISYRSNGSKSAYPVSSYCTEKSFAFSNFEMYLLQEMSLPRTHFNSFSVWICLRHTFNNVQIPLGTRSIKVLPCFDVVSLKIVLHCTGFKSNAVASCGSATEQ